MGGDPGGGCEIVEVPKEVQSLAKSEIREEDLI